MVPLEAYYRLMKIIEQVILCSLSLKLRPHTATKSVVVIDQLHLEVLTHPPYIPGWATSDFNLFAPLNEHLR